MTKKEVHSLDATDTIQYYLKNKGIGLDEVGKGGKITPAQLAKDLKMNPNTVRTILHRLRKA